MSAPTYAALASALNTAAEALLEAAGIADRLGVGGTDLIRAANQYEDASMVAFAEHDRRKEGHGQS